MKTYLDLIKRYSLYIDTIYVGDIEILFYDSDQYYTKFTFKLSIKNKLYMPFVEFLDVNYKETDLIRELSNYAYKEPQKGPLYDFGNMLLNNKIMDNFYVEHNFFIVGDNKDKLQINAYYFQRNGCFKFDTLNLRK